MATLMASAVEVEFDIPRDQRHDTEAFVQRIERIGYYLGFGSLCPHITVAALRVDDPPPDMCWLAW